MAIEKFYSLMRSDYESRFASALLRGTYEALPRCPKCNNAGRKRVPPLIVEWETEHGVPDVVADFTWPAGLGLQIVTGRVKDCFTAASFQPVAFEPVQIRQKLKGRSTAQDGPGGTPPENGSAPLWALTVDAFCSLDVERSQRSIIIDCPHCKRTRMTVHDPTAPLCIREETWQDSAFFRIPEMGDLMFVTERAKRAIAENAFSNVRVEERGCIGK